MVAKVALNQGQENNLFFSAEVGGFYSLPLDLRFKSKPKQLLIRVTLQ